MDHDEIVGKLSKMDGKLDMLIEMCQEDRKEYRSRLTSVERKQWMQTGGLAVVSAVLLPKIKLMLGL